MNDQVLCKKTSDGFPNNSVIVEVLRTYLG